MPTLFRTLLAIYLGHLATDFLLQTHSLVAQKQAGKLAGYVKHGLVHYFFVLAILGFFVQGSFLSLRTHTVILALTLAHLLIDFAKIQFTTRAWVSNGTRTFLVDQLFHLVSIVLAAEVLTPEARFPDLLLWVGRARELPDKFLLVPVIYIAVVFGGGYLIRFLTRSLADNLKKSHSQEKLSEQLQNAGLFIGWLERFMVITALLMQSPATIGLLLTAKSIARYPEFKSERFAEYFLIGTLLSISLAIVGGAILAKVIFGHVRFAG